MELESAIDYYKFGIGKAEGDDSVYVFRSISAGVNSHRATGKLNLHRTRGKFNMRCATGKFNLHWATGKFNLQLGDG